MEISIEATKVLNQCNDAIEFSKTSSSKLEKISKIRLAKESVEKFKKDFDAEIKIFNSNRALWKKILSALLFPLFTMLAQIIKLYFDAYFEILLMNEEEVRNN